MSDFTVEAKRVKTGQSLVDQETQAMNAITNLKAIKARIVELKTTVQNDPDFTAEDETKVQAVITSLLTEIDTI